MTRIVKVWIRVGLPADYSYGDVIKVKWTRNWLEVEFEGGSAKIVKNAIVAFEDYIYEEKE